MRLRGYLAPCGLVLLAACAEAPIQPAPPASPVPTAKVPSAAEVAIADHRQRAQRHAQAGDHAAAAREWRIVLLLGPGDDAARAQLDTERTAIREGVHDNLQAGNSALRRGDADRAIAAMLRVLALDPENVEAAKVLRDIDRQKLARIQNGRAARANQASAAAASRSAPGPATTPEAGESFDIDQRIEMFRAGDLAGGMRELRAFVDANPRNDTARLRIATVVYEQSQEAEQKGAREQALTLCEQAIGLRGKAMPGWAARAHALRKALSDEYFERGVRAYRTDLTSAIRLWETSLRYDPGNRKAASRLEDARAATEKLRRIDEDAKRR
jgi:tetratricopeptide (TPR) repeat protein